MAPRLPIDPKRALRELKKARDLAVASAKDPRGTAETVVEQTRGAVTLGRHLVEGVADQVREQVDRRRGGGRSGTDAPRAETPPPTPPAPAKKTPAPAKKTPATKAPSPADVAKKASAKKAPATKAAKKTAKKAAKKAPAKKTAPGDKLPPRAAAKKTPPPPPREVEPNPEAGPPRGEG